MLTIDKQFGNIYHIFVKCCNYSGATSEPVRFEFNGCWFVVDHNSWWNTETFDKIMLNVKLSTKGDIKL